LAHALPNRQLIQVHWVRVDPLHPRTLFASGAGFCHTIEYPPGYPPICPLWLMRSLDGGTTWQDLGSVLSAYPPLGQGSLSPALIAPDGHHVYVPSRDEGLSQDSGGSAFFASADGGAHWYGRWATGSYGVGIVSITFSPVSPSRLYAVDERHPPTGPAIVMWSDDAGQPGTWRSGTNPVYAFTPRIGTYRPWGGLVADPVHENTLYANIVNVETPSRRAAFVARSEDAGLDWTRVMTPTASPPLHSFRVSTDAHAGTALVGRADDPNVPADRRQTPQRPLRAAQEARVFFLLSRGSGVEVQQAQVNTEHLPVGLQHDASLGVHGELGVVPVRTAYQPHPLDGSLCVPEQVARALELKRPRFHPISQCEVPPQLIELPPRSLVFDGTAIFLEA
jgi:hypothetical protein